MFNHSRIPVIWGHFYSSIEECALDGWLPLPLSIEFVILLP